MGKSPKHLDWEVILHSACALTERTLHLKLTVDYDILREIEAESNKTLANLRMASPPNVAKVAGHVAFWIRKLKPVGHASHSPRKFLAINELVGIIVGLGICRTAVDDSRKERIALPNRIMYDWALSLRHHSHSPHSCALMFEQLAGEQ